jgi:hypothetical protein
VQRIAGVDPGEPETIAARHAQWLDDRLDELPFLLADPHQGFLQVGAAMRTQRAFTAFN